MKIACCLITKNSWLNNSITKTLTSYWPLSNLCETSYHATRVIRIYSDLFCHSFQEWLNAKTLGPKQDLDADFFTQNGYLHAQHDEVFINNPSALLSGFIHISNIKAIQGFGSKTTRLLRQQVSLIDRHNPDNKALFLRFLDQPYGITRQLVKMADYGILGAYIPAFNHITSQMQFDLFHTYTVEIHTLMLIQHLRAIILGKSQKELPLAHNVIQDIPRFRTLYLAGLFHDIGKGWGTDHSTWGAQAVQDFGCDHHLPQAEIELQAWLVQHHLTMSLTAQKTDIADPQIIERFAKKVKTIKPTQSFIPVDHQRYPRHQHAPLE